MKKISEKKLIAIILIVVIVLAGVVGWLIMSGKKPAMNYAFVSAKKGILTNVVKTTGQIKAAQEINMTFERGGTVKNVGVKVGDSVKADQILVELDSSEAGADASQAQAAVGMAKSQLAQLQAALDLQRIKKQQMLSGERPEQIQLAQTKHDSASQSLQNAQVNLTNVTNKADADRSSLVGSISDLLESASSTAADVVNRQTSGMFNSGSSANPTLVFPTQLNSTVEYRAEQQRINANRAVAQLDSLTTQVSSDYSNSDQLAGQAVDQLAIIRDYLNSLNDALNNTIVTSDMPQTRIDGFKGSVSSSLSGVNGSIAALNNYRKSVISLDAANQSLIKAAQAQVDNAQNALTLADNQLTLEKSGATREDLAAQDALIAQAQAAVNMQEGQITVAQASADKASSEFAKMTIKSPVDGVVTKLDLQPGEAVTVGSPAAGVISNAKFQIEGYVPETDIAGIKIGSGAQVTLDSVGDGKPYSARVVIIDPAATVMNGVSAYKVTLEFDQENDVIKPGLTANLRIMTDEIQNDVMIIPETALIKSGDDRFVIVNNGTSEGQRRQVIVTNFKEDGNIGVLSGLKEGEQVADFASIGKNAK